MVTNDGTNVILRTALEKVYYHQYLTPGYF